MLETGTVPDPLFGGGPRIFLVVCFILESHLISSGFFRAEIVQEWENGGRDNPASLTRSSPDAADDLSGDTTPVKEINNNPTEGHQQQPSKPWQRILPLRRSYESSQEEEPSPPEPQEEATEDVASEDGRSKVGDEHTDYDDRVWISWTSRKQVSKDGSLEDCEATTGEETSTTSGHGSACSTTPTTTPNKDDHEDAAKGDPFTDVFSDASESDSNR